MNAALVNYYGKRPENFGRDIGVAMAAVYIGQSDIILDAEEKSMMYNSTLNHLYVEPKSPYDISLMKS